jgi:hypothetical protein
MMREILVRRVIVMTIVGLLALLGLIRGVSWVLTPTAKRTIEVVLRDSQGIKVGRAVRVAEIDAEGVLKVELTIADAGPNDQQQQVVRALKTAATSLQESNAVIRSLVAAIEKPAKKEALEADARAPKTGPATEPVVVLPAQSTDSSAPPRPVETTVSAAAPPAELPKAVTTPQVERSRVYTLRPITWIFPTPCSPAETAPPSEPSASPGDNRPLEHLGEAVEPPAPSSLPPVSVRSVAGAAVPLLFVEATQLAPSAEANTAPPSEAGVEGDQSATERPQPVVSRTEFLRDPALVLVSGTPEMTEKAESSPAQPAGAAPSAPQAPATDSDAVDCPQCRTQSRALQPALSDERALLDEHIQRVQPPAAPAPTTPPAPTPPTPPTAPSAAPAPGAAPALPPGAQATPTPTPAAAAATPPAAPPAGPTAGAEFAAVSAANLAAAAGAQGLGFSDAPVMIGDEGPLAYRRFFPAQVPPPPTPPHPPTPPVPNPFRGRTPPAAPWIRGFKIADNQSPRPQDRFFFSFNYFNNLNGDINSRIGADVSHLKVYRQLYGFEKTFWDGNASFGLRVPVNTLVADSMVRGLGGTSTSFGNLTAFAKFILWQDRSGRNLISGGLSVTAPNSPTRFAGSPATVGFHDSQIQPFLGYIFATDHWFIQGFEAIDVPTDPNDVTLNYNDIGIGYFLYKDPDPNAWISSITPTFETHANIPLNHRGALRFNDPAGTADVVDLTYGANILFRRRAMLSFGFVNPVTGPKPFSYEWQLLLNVYFGRTRARIMQVTPTPPLGGG